MRDERVPRIARQEDDLRAAAFGCGNEIFPAQLIPAIGLCPLLETIVGINDSRNPRVAILLGFEREWMAVALAKIGAKKSAHPGPAAFRNRNHDGVAARKLPRPAAEVPADHARHGSTGLSLSPRPPDRLA